MWVIAAGTTRAASSPCIHNTPVRVVLAVVAIMATEPPSSASDEHVTAGPRQGAGSVSIRHGDERNSQDP